MRNVTKVFLKRPFLPPLLAIECARVVVCAAPVLHMSDSALQALLASIGFAEIPADTVIEAQLRKLFVYYCSFGDIGAPLL